MKIKWNIEFFVKIGLIPANWYYFNYMYNYPIEMYVERQQSKNKTSNKRKFKKMLSDGVNLYSKQKLLKISYSQSK